jgi:P-type E1-E2 ATPase
MTIVVEVPGEPTLELEHLVLDVNGTLTDRGALVDGVRERLAEVEGKLVPHLLSADTFGTLTAVAAKLGLQPQTIATGEDKARFVAELGAGRCAAIGNGANDVPMLELAALGIAVMGPEGTAGSALSAADVVCSSICDALDLLLDERARQATLRR